MANSEDEGPGTFKVTAYRCRCGHEWVPKDLRQEEPPRVCPKCKSYNWDRPHQFRRPERSKTQSTQREGATAS